MHSFPPLAIGSNKTKKGEAAPSTSGGGCECCDEVAPSVRGAMWLIQQSTCVPEVAANPVLLAVAMM